MTVRNKLPFLIRTRTSGALRYAREVTGFDLIPLSAPLATAGVTVALLTASTPGSGTWSHSVPIMPFGVVASATGDSLTVRGISARVNQVFGSDFSAERDWFNENKAALEGSYKGRYVAVHNETVVDSDQNLAALVNRFFGAHGPVEAYFGFVGREPSGVVAGLRL